MASVRRALILSMAERYLLIALGLASNILLARLLTPEEIGLYSVSIALIGIAQVLREFGVGNFLIQVKTLTDDHVRTAFGFSLAIGITLFLAIFLAAPLAGTFYNDERVVETIRISALNFLVLPFCSISLSLLRRDMKFKKLVAVTLVSTTLGTSSTLFLAYMGYGANSMAIGALVTNLATGIGTWFVRGDFRLMLPSFVAWRELMSFGARTSAANVITTISMDINDLAVGRILGFAPVAMISRAQGLMNLFHRDLMSAVRNVLYPAFSQAYRDGKDLEAQHVLTVTMITAIAWPFYGFAALHALDLLRLLFGPQWDAAAPLVPWFCAAGAAAATSNMIIPMLTARGRVDLATRIDLVIQPIRAVLLIIAVVVFESMDAFAITFCAIFVASTPYIYHIKSKCQKNNFRALLGGLVKSTLVSIISLTPPMTIAFFTPTTNEFSTTLRLLISSTACASFWIIAILATKHPIEREKPFLRIKSAIKLITQRINKPMKTKNENIPSHEIAMLPNWSEGNPYQNLLIGSLRKQGKSISLHDFPSGILPLNQLITQNPAIKVIHIHWINDYISRIFWSRSTLKITARILILATDITLSRIRGRRVIWTIHNSVSHESPNESLEISARKTIAITCSRIIIHSASALNTIEKLYNLKLTKKTSVIPHGNYDGCYDTPAPHSTSKEKTDRNIVILFFGAIRPYKGVEKLVEAFQSCSRQDIRLIIAGRCSDPYMSTSLEKAVNQDSRIKCILDFIPESEVQNLYNASDIVAIPFERTLTSGSAILALTMARPLILPEHAKVFDLATEDYSYFFQSIDDLKKIIESLNKFELAKMSPIARSKADTLSWEKISKETLSAYYT